MGTALLEVKDLRKHFEIQKGILKRQGYVVKAVDGISFGLNPGEVFGLVGESGCGKSTTGKLILNLIKPTAGDILFEGRSLFSLNAEELKAYRKNVQLIFQDAFASLNPRMRACDIVGEALDVHKIATTKREREERILRIFSDVGINAEWIRRYPHEFSGGQRQRIGIARALCLEPKLIVCDEPVSALDVSIQAQILNLLKEIQEKYHLAYIFISHDLKVVKHLCDRVAVMYLGRIVELASKKDLFSSPLHPYTKALISVIPNPDPRAKPQKIILKGEVSRASWEGEGCHFAERCFAANEICRREMPFLKKRKEDHWVACHFFSEEPEERSL